MVPPLTAGCGRVAFAVSMRVRASGWEIVRVSRSRAAVLDAPWVAAIFRVSISPAIRTWAVNTSRAWVSKVCREGQQLGLGERQVVRCDHGADSVGRGISICFCRLQHLRYRHKRTLA